MFSIYITITKGQRSSFKKFLSGHSSFFKKILPPISHKFLEDQLKCLRLYHCFKEADDHTLCHTIEQANIFHNREISLVGTTLTASDMECISLFLTSSFNKEWERLNFPDCYIQDKGLNILYRGLRHSSNVIINRLRLLNNGLTTQSSYLISELTVKCQVKRLGIAHNDYIGEDRQLYSMLTNPSNVLEYLNMSCTRLSSKAATDLFAALKENNKLKVLYIEYNAITDDACDAITTALERNSCLVTLGMYGNPLSSEAMMNIVRCLKANNMLQLIGLPDCPQNIQENIKSLEVFNKRESQGCQEVKSKIKFGLVS